MANEEKFAERLQLVNDTIAMKPTARVPMMPNAQAYPYFRYGCTWKDSMYNPDAAADAFVKYHEEYQPDAMIPPMLTSGKANEIADSKMIDWPGRPGTGVPDESTYQFIEIEFMKEDEYPELLSDYTGFMLRKYIPRAFPELAGLANVQISPIVMNADSLTGLFNPATLAAFGKMDQIGAEVAKMGEVSQRVMGQLMGMGFPPYFTGMGEVPFDVLSDMFRLTLGASMDLVERPDEVKAACEMFADMQIAGFQYFRFVDMPVKRVFFPLHKGMDGFMDDRQYAEVYWAPFRRILDALIEMGVTPFIYTEGPYNTRLDFLAENVPEKKCIVHFETVDIARAKASVGQVSCISGNLPIQDLMYSDPKTVADKTKVLLETCMPGGGYIFDTNAAIDYAKPENVEAMYEVVREYGKY